MHPECITCTSPPIRTWPYKFNCVNNLFVCVFHKVSTNNCTQNKGLLSFYYVCPPCDFTFAIWAWGLIFKIFPIFVLPCKMCAICSRKATSSCVCIRHAVLCVVFELVCCAILKLTPKYQLCCTVKESQQKAQDEGLTSPTGNSVFHIRPATRDEDDEDMGKQHFLHVACTNIQVLTALCVATTSV